MLCWEREYTTHACYHAVTMRYLVSYVRGHIRHRIITIIIIAIVCRRTSDRAGQCRVLRAEWLRLRRLVVHDVGDVQLALRNCSDQPTQSSRLIQPTRRQVHVLHAHRAASIHSVIRRPPLFRGEGHREH